MAFFENNGPDTPIKDEKSGMADLMYMITPEQLSSACATPDEDESTSGASTTNDDGGTPLSLPTDESMAANGSMPGFVSGKDSSSMMTPSSPSKSRRAAAAAAAQHSLLPNGKKTKGRVKIKMEFIDNKLRRYTTFSKRKTGIMKKAYELSTLTGTQVMLLVASETGHVYTFATKKLQPMITSEAGKALIQTCLNSPDSADGPPHFGESTALSANFHTSEIASLTPASLLFASGVTGNNSGASVNQSQQQRQSSNNNSAKRSHKSHQLQQQHCASAIQDVLAAAAQSRAGGSAGKIDNGDLSILNDLGVGNVKGASKGSYYNASELPTMVPPNSSNRFTLDNNPTPNFFSQTAESGIGDEEEGDMENGDLSSLSLGMGDPKDQQHEQDLKSGDANRLVNGSAKRRPFQKHGSSPSSSTSSATTNNTPAGSTLNNILHNIVASRQQQRQQAASGVGQNQNQANQQLQHQNRRKRPHVGNPSQFSGSGSKQQNIFGQSSGSSNSQQSSNLSSSTAQQQLGSHLFPFAGLVSNAAAMNGAAAGVQSNSQQAAFSLFPSLGNGAFFFPPGLVYTPPTSGLPEGTAAALALQQMIAAAMANGTANAQQQSQASSNAGNGRNSSPAVQGQHQPLIPSLSLPLSVQFFQMMTANYLAAQQSQREMQSDDFDESGQAPLDEEESD